MIKILYLILFLWIPAAGAGAQTASVKSSPPLSEGSPGSAGVSAERLARIDRLFEKAIEDGDLPGIVALMARNGKIIYHKAFGMADNQSGRALEKDDIFRIASQTKAITSTAVMMLWEEGRFRLDDPVSRYIPEFRNPQVLATFDYNDTSYTTVPANGGITIRHLLTHTSGIGYGIIDSDPRFRMIYRKAGITDLFTTEDISIEENVKRLAALPLHHHPGENYIYSEGLDVLGYFIEVLSGMPFDRFLRERLFDPLGMDDTWFYLPKDKSPRLVTVQEKSESGEWVPYTSAHYDPEYPVKGARRFFSGGAGLSSTAKDYATFLQMYLNDGELNGIRILSRTTVRFMMANHIGDLWGEDPEKQLGLAFGVLTQKGEDRGGQGSTGTFDWGGYFNTQYFADPREQIIGVLMKQTRGPVSDNTAWQFRLLTQQAVDD
jgi:CubicO group peptidase (beta-lactamase class C family)